jgi:hypothetical protein
VTKGSPPSLWRLEGESKNSWVPNQSRWDGGMPSLHETGTGHASQKEPTHKWPWNEGEWVANSSWNSGGRADRC